MSEKFVSKAVDENEDRDLTLWIIAASRNRIM